MASRSKQPALKEADAKTIVKIIVMINTDHFICNITLPSLT